MCSFRLGLAVLLISVFLFGAATPGLAYTPAEQDDLESRWSLGDPENQMHVMGGYAFTLTECLILEKVGMKRWAAVLTSVATTIILGAAKEQWLDPYFSRKDLYADIAGASVAGITVLVFRF
jgi:hypothetical protein